MFNIILIYKTKISEKTFVFPAFYEKNTKLTANSLNFIIKNISKSTINKIFQLIF